MSDNTKKLPLWPIFLIIIIIIVLAVLNPICRYFYTKDFVKRGDEQLAELFAHDIQTKELTDSPKPIFFFGSSKTRTNASCLDVNTGSYDIYSVFDVADRLSLDTLEASQYIITYLNSLGYNYTAPTQKDWDLYESEMKEHVPLWKTFPWYDGILETEHCIIVQLSN